MPLLRHAARSLSVVLGLSVPVQPLTAQVNEADRIARCQNNAARMQALQAEIAGETTWDEETIARARTAMISMRAKVRNYNYQLDLWGYSPIPQATPYHESMDKLHQEILEIGRSFNITCRSEDGGCPSRLLAQIERSIDQGVAALPAHNARVQQWNAHRSNFIALRCDESATAPATVDRRQRARSPY